MSDLVERLRDLGAVVTREEAADCIEELEAVIREWGRTNERQMNNEWHGPRYWEGRWRDEAKENERLCNRIEALEADRRAWANQINKNTGLMDAARDRIEALEAEVATLRGTAQSSIETADLIEKIIDENVDVICFSDGVTEITNAADLARQILAAISHSAQEAQQSYDHGFRAGVAYERDNTDRTNERS
jgi:hypothetical protein